MHALLALLCLAALPTNIEAKAAALETRQVAVVRPMLIERPGDGARPDDMDHVVVTIAYRLRKSVVTETFEVTKSDDGTVVAKSLGNPSDIMAHQILEAARAEIAATTARQTAAFIAKFNSLGIPIKRIDDHRIWVNATDLAAYLAAMPAPDETEKESEFLPPMAEPSDEEILEGISGRP